MTMCGPSASASWRGQQPLVTYPHNELVSHRGPDFIDTTRHLSTFHGSSGQSALPPQSDPANNQRPGSHFFNQHPPAQIHGTHFQNHHFREQSAMPPRPLRAAPGENPHANQKPGTYFCHPHRHGTHHQHRSRPYPSYTLPRHQVVGHQQATPHSNAYHPWHGIPALPTPSTTSDYGSFTHMALPTLAAAPAQPQGPYINEAATMHSHSPPVGVPEATMHVLSPGAQPAGTPTLSTEASPNLSRSVIGPCPDPTCNSNQKWGRKQELERHVLRHLPIRICCPHPDCTWTGSRRYSFVEHYTKKHAEHNGNVPSPEEFALSEAKLLAKRLVNGETTMAIAIEEAETLVQKKQGRLET